MLMTISNNRPVFAPAGTQCCWHRQQKSQMINCQHTHSHWILAITPKQKAETQGKNCFAPNNVHLLEFFLCVWLLGALVDASRKEKGNRLWLQKEEKYRWSDLKHKWFCTNPGVGASKSKMLPLTAQQYIIWWEMQTQARNTKIESEILKKIFVKNRIGKKAKAWRCTLRIFMVGSFIYIVIYSNFWDIFLYRDVPKGTEWQKYWKYWT